MLLNVVDHHDDENKAYTSIWMGLFLRPKSQILSGDNFNRATNWFWMREIHLNWINCTKLEDNLHFHSQKLPKWKVNMKNIIFAFFREQHDVYEIAANNRMLYFFSGFDEYLQR